MVRILFFFLVCMYQLNWWYRSLTNLNNKILIILLFEIVCEVRSQNCQISVQSTKKINLKSNIVPFWCWRCAYVAGYHWNATSVWISIWHLSAHVCAMMNKIWCLGAWMPGIGAREDLFPLPNQTVKHFSFWYALAAGWRACFVNNLKWNPCTHKSLIHCTWKGIGRDEEREMAYVKVASSIEIGTEREKKKEKHLKFKA